MTKEEFSKWPWFWTTDGQIIAIDTAGITHTIAVTAEKALNLRKKSVSEHDLANAQLIAAAPLMFATLDKLRNELTKTSRNDLLDEIYRALLQAGWGRN